MLVPKSIYFKRINKPTMKPNKKKAHTALDTKDTRLFFKNLKKFKQRHPDFDLEKVMKKLYPNLDLKDI
jgi:uridine kinase